MDRRSLLKGAALMGGAASALAGSRAEAAPKGHAASRPHGAVYTSLSGSTPAAYAPVIGRLKTYIDAHRAAYNLPGMTFTLADRSGFRGQIVSGLAEVEAGRPVKGSDLFEIGSISKSFVGLSLFRAMEAGKVSLSDRLVDVLPGAPLADDSPVTVQHLLAHSGGLPDDAPVFPRMNGGLLWSDFKPGGAWSYSNTGYELLGLLLEHIHGRPLNEILHAEVLKPLGMTAAQGAIRDGQRRDYAPGYCPQHLDEPYPLAGPLAPAPWVPVFEGQGCIAATAADMSRYLAWLIAAAAGKGAPLLSNAAAARYLAPVIDAPDWAPKAKYANGLAVVQVDDRSLIHHTGGMIAYSSAFHVDGQAGVGAFASTNVGMTGYRPRNITSYACALMRWARDGGAEPKAPPLPSFDVDKAAEAVGVFTAPDGERIEIRAAGKGLTLTHGGVILPLEPRGPDRFLARQPRFSRYGLVGERAGGKLRAFWWGDVEFAADPSAPRRPVDPRLQALAGRYDNDNPWKGVARIVARPTGLWAGGDQPLIEGPDSVWRFAGDPPPPERLAFEAPLAGRPFRLVISGVDFYRRDD